MSEFGMLPAGYGYLGAGGAGTAVAATGLSTAAAVGAGSGPFAPIVGGAIAGATGVAVLIIAIRDKRINSRDAAREAERLGVEDASDFPRFVARALKWDNAKFAKEIDEARRRSQKFHLFRSKRKNAQKLQILLEIQRLKRGGSVRVSGGRMTRAALGSGARGKGRSGSTVTIPGSDAGSSSETPSGFQPADSAFAPTAPKWPMYVGGGLLLATLGVVGAMALSRRSSGYEPRSGGSNAPR